MNHKKIAELAHVSPSTVSKALSGSNEISREISDKVRKIAIEQGYFKEKNKRKREYSNNCEIVIAVIVPEIEGLYYSSIVTYIKNAIKAKGGYAAIYIFDFDEERKNKISEMIILNGSADGIMLFSTPNFDLNTNIPIICTDCQTKECTSIGNDMEAVLNDAVKLLKEKGHKKIGFIGEYNTISKSNAFIKAMKDNNLCLNEKYMYIIDDRFEAIGVKAAKAIINQIDRPTAIITAYDEIAISLTDELMKNNIKIPDDISVMGMNNIVSSAYSKIPLTTIETFCLEQYKIGIDILFDKILNGTNLVKHIVVEHRIIERDSIKGIEE